MTNAEIIKGAAKIFRMCITATYNDQYGEDDGTMNVTMARLIKAVEWARKNNEEMAMRTVFTNISNGYNNNMTFAMIADNIIDTIF